jgi:methylthioribose-1-phosphate isomerase
MVRTIYWDGKRAMILDQARLPHEVTYIGCTDHRMVCDCIRDMNIRGAPAIGIASAMGIALGAAESGAASYGEFMADLDKVFADLLATRPTAVNIQWAVNRTKALLETKREEPVEALKQALADEAVKILDEDREVNRAIGRWGSKFIKDGARVLTHCNAGSLATGGYGTATAPILVAKEEGKQVSVFADETRPLLQGRGSPRGNSCRPTCR